MYVVGRVMRMAESSEFDTDLLIVVDDDEKLGTFANAFRVVEEAGPDCFLDFLAYSAQEQRARVVSRVRVRRAFLPVIRDTLAEFQVGFAEVTSFGRPRQ